MNGVEPKPTRVACCNAMSRGQCLEGPAQRSQPGCTSVQNVLCVALQDPNPDDPLNKEAAEMQTNSPRQFEAQVQASILRGCSINGHYFPPCRA